jgi:hypothetical protein
MGMEAEDLQGLLPQGVVPRARLSEEGFPFGRGPFESLPKELFKSFVSPAIDGALLDGACVPAAAVARPPSKSQRSLSGAYPTSHQ